SCQGRELVGLSEDQFAKIRGETIAFVPQDPLSSLNPAFKVGWQVSEAIWTKGKVPREQADRRAIELLDLVGIPQAAKRAESYPHEFSGGMRQRVVIAMAMANDPKVIIADEPTTALDVTIQAQVLEALKAARDEAHASLILITHDLGVVAGMADRVMVMYAGRAVETGPAEEIYYRSRMPYTLGLLGSLPRLDEDRQGPLRPIPGSPPSLLNLPPGCSFAVRCPMAIEQCLREDPALKDVTALDHQSACHRSGELGDVGTELFAPTWTDTGNGLAAELSASDVTAAVQSAGPTDRTVIEVAELVKHFPVQGGRLIRHQVGEAHAVCGVSFDL